MPIERAQLIAWLINNCLVYGPVCVVEGHSTRASSCGHQVP